MIALAGSVAALVVAGILGFLPLRAHRRAAARLAHAFAQISARADALSRELVDAFERLERTHALAGLYAATDLSGVLEWTARAAATVTGSNTGVVHFVDAEGTLRVAAHGMPLDEARAPALLWPVDRPRAVSFTYDYPVADETASRVRSGLTVPVGTSPDPNAFVTVLSSDPVPPSVEALEALEMLAARVAPAIATAPVAQDDPLAPPDALTGLGTRRTFHEALVREVARAHSRAHPLTVLVMDLDDFRTVNARLGLVAADLVLSDVAARVDETVPEPGLSCRIGADEFAVILPGSTVTDAESVFAVVQASLRRLPPEPVDRLALSAGISELGTDDDPLRVLGRAAEALRRAKRSGRGTAVVATS